MIWDFLQKPIITYNLIDLAIYGIVLALIGLVVYFFVDRVLQKGGF